MTWSVLAYWRTTTAERVALEFDGIIAASYTAADVADLLLTSANAMAWGF
jgi:hypothetical protein